MNKITTFDFDIRSLEPGYYIISCEGYDNVEFVRTPDNVWLKKTLGAYDLYGKIENPVNAYFKWEEIDKVYIKRRKGKK